LATLAPPEDDSEAGSLGAADLDLSTLVVALRSRADNTLDQLADGLEADGEVAATVQEDINGQQNVVVKLAVPPEVVMPSTIEEYGPLWDVLTGIVRYHELELAAVRIAIKPRNTRWPQEGQRRHLVGRRVGGRYLLQDEVLGSGGSSVVRLAHDEQDDEFVAVKLLIEVNDALRTGQRQRFLREMRLLRQLDHPHVMPALNFGEEDDGLLWVAMPRAEMTLRQNRFTGDAAKIAEVFGGICEGVEAMHASGVIHRDLKPSNVLFVDGVWKVSDLGIAADFHPGTTTITLTRETMGTPHYAPPERDRPHDASPAWDVFSLGVILADLWTGREAQTRPSNAMDGPFRACVTVATRADAASRCQVVSALREQTKRAIHLATAGHESLDDKLARISAELGEDAPIPMLGAVVESLVVATGEHRHR